jgi:hypothetical protein
VLMFSPTSAKRLECVRLAGAFRGLVLLVARGKSGSKLHALHTLRVIRRLARKVLWFLIESPPENE